MTIANSAEKEEGWSLLRQKTILDQQKPLGGQHGRELVQEYEDEEMAIAKSAKEEAGFNLLKWKTTQLCLHRNFQVAKKRRRITKITRAMR